MAERELTLLQQRAEERKQEREKRKQEMQQLRHNNVDLYVEELREKSRNGTMGPARTEMPRSRSKKIADDGLGGTQMMREMRQIANRINSPQAAIDGKRREAENAAREARDRDLNKKNEVKRAQENARNLETVGNVFKSEGDKITNAIEKLGKKLNEKPAPNIVERYVEREKTRNRRPQRQRTGTGPGPGRHTTRGPDGRYTRRRAQTGASGSGIDEALDIDLDLDPPDRERDRNRRQTPREMERERRRQRRMNRRAGGGLRGAWNRARGFGAGAGAAGGSSSAAGSLGLGSKLLGAVKVLGGIGAAADVAMSSAPLVSTVFDSKADTATRIGAGAHLATTAAGGVIGGVLGGTTGAAYGAYAGDKVASGAEWLGRQIADNVDVHDLINNKDGMVQKTSAAVSSQLTAVQQSAVGKAIGMSAAVAMAPFNEDARKAFVRDWNQTIMPKFEDTFSKFSSSMSNYGQAIQKASSQILDGAKNAANDVFKGAQKAGEQIAEAYKKDGLKGAVQSVIPAVKSAGSGFSTAASSIKQGVMNAGSELRYGAQKGTASAVDLALGFSAKKGFSGMSDSESKAYAANVMKTESGGRMDIVNPYGFTGQYQFGADALADNGLIDKDKLKAAKKAAGASWYKGGEHKKFMADNSNWINAGGRDEFLKNKQLQDDTFVQYTDRNIKAGYKSGALSANSSSSDIAGYAKAAHLKGSGGADNYFLRGIDSTDANGTKVSDYAKGASTSMLSLAAKVDAEKSKIAPDMGAKVAGKAVTTSGDKSGGKSVPDVKVVALPVVKPDRTEQTVQEKPLVAQIQNLKSSESETRSSPMPSNKARSEMKETHIAQSQLPVATFAPVIATPANSAMPVARASAQPEALVSKSVPRESQSVVYVNAPEPQKQQGSQVAHAPSRQSDAPTLQEMPLMINDLGLVLLNIGHV